MRKRLLLGRRSDRPSTRARAQATVREQIEEGVLISAAGVRLIARNQFILRTLRDGTDFDARWHTAAVAHELTRLAAESDHDADRLARSRRRARARFGYARLPDDFRRRDADMLVRRIQVLRGLSDRLRALSRDTAFVASLLEGARQSALDDLMGADRHAFEDQGPRTLPADYLDGRLERIADLLDDLTHLESRRSEAAGPTASQ